MSITGRCRVREQLFKRFRPLGKEERQSLGQRDTVQQDDGQERLGNGSRIGVGMALERRGGSLDDLFAEGQQRLPLLLQEWQVRLRVVSSGPAWGIDNSQP